MAPQQNRKSIDVLETTKADGLKILAQHFPPGTSAWAFWNDIVTQTLAAFEAGTTEVLGVRAKVDSTGNGKATRIPAGAN